MIEIIYGDNRELAGLEGRTVAEARKEYEMEFDIPGRAQAVLNGEPLKKKVEAETRLREGDELCFVKKTRSRVPVLIATLLAALALTSGTFAYTFISNSVSFTEVTAAGGDFAKVTSNISAQPDWNTYGFFMGNIGGPYTLFDIDTANSTYTGDLVATISIANGDQLAQVYRVLAMKITCYDSGENLIDINSDNTASASTDFALLTLRNGAVDIFINQDGGSDVYTVKLESGYYVSHIWGLGWGGSNPQQPILYCDLGQR